jgi:hypothetical protein
LVVVKDLATERQVAEVERVKLRVTAAVFVLDLRVDRCLFTAEFLSTVSGLRVRFLETRLGQW